MRERKLIHLGNRGDFMVAGVLIGGEYGAAATKGNWQAEEGNTN